MRITFDPSAGAAYIYIVDTVVAGEARQSVPVHDGDVVLDLDANGKLLGIEILGAERPLRPETLSAAEQLG
jgi:uncharacterized protein YuzE